MNKSKKKHTYEADLMTLVKMVEERPSVWDKSYVKEPGERRKAWLEICKHFAPINFDDMEKDEQTKLEHYLTGKWQNLRDTFTKMAKKHCEQTYKYYEHMKFLLKNLDLDKKPPPLVENNENEELPPKRIRRIPPSFRINLTHKRRRLPVGPNIEANSTALCIKDAEEELSSPEMSTPANNVVAAKNVVPTPESHLKSNDLLDEDEAFFISIMPSVKRLSDEDKLEFRMGVLGTIREISQRSRMNGLLSASNSPCSNLLFVT